MRYAQPPSWAWANTNCFPPFFNIITLRTATVLDYFPPFVFSHYAQPPSWAWASHNYFPPFFNIITLRAAAIFFYTAAI
jgi:hypothetical protein